MQAGAPTIKNVAYTHEDRQWDARFNVQDDADLEQLLDGIRSDADKGKFKYCLVGGVEIGTRSYQDDYGIKHVHVAAVFVNRTSKRAILKNWNIVRHAVRHDLMWIAERREWLLSRTKEPRSPLLVRAVLRLTITICRGWKNHHTKAFSKVDPNKLVLFETGTLPTDLKRQRVEASEEEKKRKIDEILIEMKGMLEEGKDDECFNKFPKHTLMYGEKLKSTLKQRRIEACNEGNPHLWVTGYPGTGKTAILHYIYPNAYKKNLYNRFFDLYDPKVHTHVIMEDLDHEAVEKLSINFIKTICDEAGFSIDQKYKTPQLARTTVLVTSNFGIRDIVPESAGFHKNVAAIQRRFWECKIYELLRLLQLKLVPKETRAALKKEGNSDVSKLFLDWDYVTDIPTGKPIKEPAYYQQAIRDYFYALTS